jgi:hypothetical protein
MELTRRLVFRGNAVAFGGRIVRPEDVVLEMPGASSIPVAGGRTRWRGSKTRFKNFVSFESAATLAEGLFDDLAGAIALSNHTVAEASLTMTTRVRGEISTLVVGSKKRLRVGRAAIELKSKSPAQSGEPPIAVVDAVLDQVTIDGFKLKFTLERALFERYDTFAKVLTAFDDPAFAKKYGRMFRKHHTTIYATLVRKLEWDGPANPDAEIDEHTVVVKDFGRIAFGEVLIASTARRVTMIRLELGSDEGGAGGGPDVDINGTWYP